MRSRVVPRYFQKKCINYKVKRRPFLMRAPVVPLRAALTPRMLSAQFYTEFENRF